MNTLVVVTHYGLQIRITGCPAEYSTREAADWVKDNECGFLSLFLQPTTQLGLF